MNTRPLQEETSLTVYQALQMSLVLNEPLTIARAQLNLPDPLIQMKQAAPSWMEASKYPYIIPGRNILVAHAGFIAEVCFVG